MRSVVFFIIGMTRGRKDLEFSQMMICDQCGSYGRYTVFMTYMCLSFFFLPLFKWKKQYFVQSTCCNTLYGLDPETGKQIEKGSTVEIRPEHLTLLEKGFRNRSKKCMNCGYETREEFDYCPKCGRRL